MNKEVKQIAYLQLESARQFLLITHNGDRLHIAGSISLRDQATVLANVAKALGMKLPDLMIAFKEVADDVYAEGAIAVN